jgi:hypothetical protein
VLYASSHGQCQQEQQQQLQQQSPTDVVLRVVLSADPSAATSSSVLRPFHSVCSEGRAAALRSICHLHLDRAAEQRVPPERQLAVLAAADHATALTLHSSQVEGLVACLLEGQQQNEDEQVLVQEGIQQLSLEPTAGAADSTALTTNAINSSSCHPTHSLAPNPISAASSSSTTTTTDIEAGAATNTLPAAKPRGPYFKQLTVTGPVTAATIQHLEQLLDLLPGTQTLEEVVVEDAIKPGVLEYYREVWESLSWQEPRWLFGLASGAAAQAYSSTTSSSRTRVGPAIPATDSSSWRSSCGAMAVALKHTGIENPSHNPLDQFAPLLGSLQQPRSLFLAGVSLGSLPRWVGRLQPLQALQIVVTLSVEGEVVSSMAALTNLRHLGINACVLPITTIPAAFTNLVHLTSLEFTISTLTPEALEGVCGITTLQQLNLMHTKGFTSLPNSISKLVGLRGLMLQNTEVTTLPECLTTSTALGMLMWSHRDAAVALELEVVWRLRSLYVLEIADDHLAALPEDIGQLTGLLSLGVASRALAGLPDALTTLGQLRSLYLDAPQLRALPEGITALTGLKQLRATGVRLRKQPPAVRGFLEGCQGQGCGLDLARDNVWAKWW